MKVANQGQSRGTCAQLSVPVLELSLRMQLRTIRIIATPSAQEGYSIDHTGNQGQDNSPKNNHGCDDLCYSTKELRGIGGNWNAW